MQGGGTRQNAGRDINTNTIPRTFCPPHQLFLVLLERFQRYPVPPFTKMPHRVLLSLSRRTFTTSNRVRSAFSPGPSPPRLPKEEQEIFDRLQRQSTGAFSTPRSATSATDSAPPTGGVPTTSRPQVNQSPATEANLKAEIDARGEGQELHPDVRRGAAPEFQGEVNPRTGEVGGPKNDPLRWGGGGDWSYNGRVTDF